MTLHATRMTDDELKFSACIGILRHFESDALKRVLEVATDAKKHTGQIVPAEEQQDSSQAGDSRSRKHSSQ